MVVNVLEKVSINNSDQWLLVRGKDANNPLILQIQAGPGLPMISEAKMLQRLHHLEDDFLVAYWDQRDCGKSFSKNEEPDNINLNQLADDLISCTKYLLKKYKRDKVTLVGYSMGATISFFAAQKAPALFSNVFSVGADIDLPTANNFALEFLLDKTQQHKNTRSAKEVRQLQGVEINSARLFQKRAKLITNFGGIISGKSYKDILFVTVKNMFFNKEYTWSDIIKTIRGMEFSQNALLPEFNRLNLFEKIKAIEVPVHFIQGRKDAVAPMKISIAYFEFLSSVSKSFTEFKHSAHLPHLEEPDKFAEVLRAKINQKGTSKTRAIANNNS